MLACCLQRVARRLLTSRFTASAFCLSDPRRNKMSSTEGVVCAIAEWRGDRALGRGELAMTRSKYSKSSMGSFVLAHRCGRLGQSQVLSEMVKNKNKIE